MLPRTQVAKIKTGLSFVLMKFLLIAESADLNANENFYTVGTVEFNPSVDIHNNNNNNLPWSIESNLNSYVEFIKLAKAKNVDILVFPEATFNYPTARESGIQEALIVPDEKDKIAPCDHPKDFSNELVTLSKTARDHSIYVLVNIVEKVACTTNPKICAAPYNKHNDKYSLYNTNIVFDRYGRIVSKYRKVNLYVEPLLDVPLDQQIATFDTDFNVRFGHFICFDILFKYPARDMVKREGIKHILYPNYWYGHLPFFSSATIHQAWAYSNNVNLLAAGGNSPDDGTTGTGAYFGRNRIEFMFMCPVPVQKLFTTRVPKNDHTVIQPLVTGVDDSCKSTDMLKMNVFETWSDEDHPILPLTASPQTICVNADRICCTVEYKKVERPSPPGKLVYSYALVVNYSTAIYGRTRKAGEIACAIVTCTGRSLKTCGRRFKSHNVFQSTEFEHVTIKAKIRSTSFEDILIMPNTLTTGFYPFKMSSYSVIEGGLYNEKGRSYKDFILESHGKLPDFLVYGFYGRDFTLDDPFVG